MIGSRAKDDGVRVTWGKAPPGQSAPHLNTNLVCEWVHLVMSNDAPCWKSVNEPNKFDLNNNLCK